MKSVSLVDVYLNSPLLDVNRQQDEKRPAGKRLPRLE
ncbi:hypothetical protein LMG29542_07914 [Paraburkholderia humisilvae]|uniref:Uncharacterized protein n=1 Tax=Paraburkholderia humisilvae TaxID=627669 RepID=A0A6J5FAP9_9BURK|nr:hypothetical protein LMG29542_07914 [Paraburkholderia humisilvae]